MAIEGIIRLLALEYIIFMENKDKSLNSDITKFEKSYEELFCKHDERNLKEFNLHQEMEAFSKQMDTMG
ncbi:hypothetical protein C2S52_013537 [Perilla frutescens var. hirtella]|nr:hypothetical protein C2S51_015830 [Perilla frutescens var. frutescens]KAH6775976.1 hypothetical protein C2S52_013537 [Perilla frutescens var. hirtella]